LIQLHAGLSRDKVDATHAVTTKRIVSNCGLLQFPNPKKQNTMPKKQVNLSVGRGEKLSVAQGGGLSERGRKKYNAATGSNLKPPAPNPKTPAEKGRKASFCARSQGWDGERGKAARKRWGC